ncbi:MAG: sporulation protein YqfD, partial [Bacilli bacterium]|nr:sporulation protein YqfD [Bacilli bacterium]
IKVNDNKYQILKSRIKNKKEDEINLYKLNDFEINLVKEKEYTTKVKKLSEEEAYNKGINTALEKVKLKLLDNEEILLKKVLKKEVNDSTIYLEIFIVTKENIGELQVVSEEINYGVESNT